MGLAPGGIAAARVELDAVDAPAPDAHLGVHARTPQPGRRRQGGDQHLVAAAVELQEPLLHHRLQEAQAVVGQIGLEAGVQAGHHGAVHAPGQPLGLEADDVGRRHMHDVGREVLDVASERGGHAEAEAVFRAAGQGHRRDRRQPLHLGRFRRRGGVDAHLRMAILAQMADQPAQRLGGAVAGVVEVAREQGDAQGTGRQGGLRIGSRPGSPGADSVL